MTALEVPGNGTFLVADWFGGAAVSGIVSGGSTSYRGIPFAGPAAGSLRWRPPAPAAPWSGVRPANTYAAIRVQLDAAGNVTGSVKCLTLNVWTPAVPPASYAYYDGTTFVEKGRAVVVTANYRLSSFGCLAQSFDGIRTDACDFWDSLVSSL